jgi:2,5-diamino-6-(ribosylamino)-4(3H)-pyrimidinone 5'-phosphate reductase
MVGANTVIIDDPSLRLKFVKGKEPDKIIVDGKLRVPINARVFTINPSKAVILTTKEASTEKVETLRDMGVRVLILGDRSPIDMEKAMEELWKKGYRKIMAEGGGELLWSLFKSNVADELHVTIAPFIFGGRDAVSLVMGEGFKDTSEAVKLEPYDVKLCECEREIHIKYRILSRIDPIQI